MVLSQDKMPAVVCSNEINIARMENITQFIYNTAGFCIASTTFKFAFKKQKKLMKEENFDSEISGKT